MSVWAYRDCEKLKGHRNAKDQLLRASPAMALKTIEGKGPRPTAKRRTGIDAGVLKSHERSALECAAIQDVRQACEALFADDNRKQKALLDRLVAMLTKLGQRGYAVREELGEYRVSQFDTDTD